MRRMMRKSLDLKVVLLGRAADGKTSLVERYVNNKLPNNNSQVNASQSPNNNSKTLNGTLTAGLATASNESVEASSTTLAATTGSKLQRTSNTKEITSNTTANNSHQSTIGAAYSYKNIQHGGRSINVSLLDTAGNERYESLNRFFIRGAKATIIVIDITKSESIEKARYWLAQVDELEPECAKYLCVTKMDLVESGVMERLLDESQLQQMISSSNNHQQDNSAAASSQQNSNNSSSTLTGQTKIFYTSCLTGNGIQELFQEIICDFMARYQAERAAAKAKRGRGATSPRPSSVPGAAMAANPPMAVPHHDFYSTASKMFSKALVYSGFSAAAPSSTLAASKTGRKQRAAFSSDNNTDNITATQDDNGSMIFVENDPHRTPMNECTEAWDAVHAILSQAAAPELIANCKSLHDACTCVATYAGEYDFNEKIHANGYWSWVRLVVKFYDLILTTYRPHKTQAADKDPVDAKLIAICEILLVQYRLLQEMRADSLAKEERVLSPPTTTYPRLSLTPVPTGKSSASSSKQTSPSKERSIVKQVREHIELGLEAEILDKEQLVKQLSPTSTGPRLTADLFASNTDEFQRMLQVYYELESQLQYIYGRYCSFWLCPSMRRAMVALTVVMGMYVNRSQTGTALRCLWDREHRGQIVTRLAQSANTRVMKNICNLNENSLLHSVPKIWSKTSGDLKVARDIYAPRQSDWIIPPSGTVQRSKPATEPQAESTTKPNPIPPGGNRIRCRLLVADINKPSPGDAILFHCHGGGFISQSPDTHEVYLREWAAKLDNVPLLSIAYSLSPEETYPVALQQILDVYLWLWSDSDSVKEIFGFKPKKIVLAGDSAGGNMNAALLLMISDINRIIYGTVTGPNEQRLAPIPLPSSLVLLYTPLLLKTVISPSRLFSMLDTLLSFGLLLCCLDAYLGHHKFSLDKFPDLSNTLNTPGGSRTGSACSTPHHLSKADKKALKKKNKKSNLVKGLIPGSNGGSRTPSRPGTPSRATTPVQMQNMADIPLGSDCDDGTNGQIPSPNPNTLEVGAERRESRDTSVYETPAASIAGTASPVPELADDIAEQDFAEEFVEENFAGDEPLPASQQEQILGSSASEPIKDQAWYKLPQAELLAKLDQLNCNAANRYVSPLLLEDLNDPQNDGRCSWDDFQDVPLYLIALHFDACLDDMVSLAKQWKGPVSLDVLNDLPHGFLNFISFSEEAKRGCDLCITRLRQALQLPPL